MKKIMKEYQKGILFFNKIILNLLNTIILFVVYFIGVGFTKLITKFLNIRTLNTKINKNKKSYWVKHEYDVNKNRYRLF